MNFFTRNQQSAKYLTCAIPKYVLCTYYGTLLFKHSPDFMLGMVIVRTMLFLGDLCLKFWKGFFARSQWDLGIVGRSKIYRFRRQISARPCQNSAARTSDPNPTAHPLIRASSKVGVGASPKVLRALELLRQKFMKMRERSTIPRSLLGAVDEPLEILAEVF
jgi:hypothetical protein